MGSNNMQDVDVEDADIMMKGHHEEVIIFLKFTFRFLIASLWLGWKIAIGRGL